MAIGCKTKLRFATKGFAEQVIRDMQTREHHVRSAKLMAYFCSVHRTWHIGHSNLAGHGVGRQKLDYVTADALGRLYGLRESLVASFGKTQDARDWSGVRALTGAIRHLSR